MTESADPLALRNARWAPLLALLADLGFPQRYYDLCDRYGPPHGYRITEQVLDAAWVATGLGVERSANRAHEARLGRASGATSTYRRDSHLMLGIGVEIGGEMIFGGLEHLCQAMALQAGLDDPRFPRPIVHSDEEVQALIGEVVTIMGELNDRAP